MELSLLHFVSPCTEIVVEAFSDVSKLRTKLALLSITVSLISAQKMSRAMVFSSRGLQPFAFFFSKGNA